MADGTVTIKVDAETKRAQAELAKLERSFQKTAAAMEKTTSDRNVIAEQLDVAKTKADETRAHIKELKAQLSETTRDLSGYGRDMTPDDVNAAKQVQQELVREIAQQEKSLASQEKTISRLETKEADITRKLQQQTTEYEKQREQVGLLRSQLMQSGGVGMKQLKAGAESVTKSFQVGFKTILKYAFGIRSLYFLARKLKSGIVEGFKGFAEKDPETQANINALKASLNGLKLSWGAAFAPIINLVTPWLNKLIDMLIAAGNALNMFFSALAGKSTYKKVVKNMDSVAGAAGGAGEAAEEAKKQIMGFDEINRLENNSGGGGGGGGGSGVGLGNVEEEAINPKLLSALDWVKDHMKEILAVAGAIGAALLAWKLSSIFGTSLTRMLGIIMSIAGAVLLVKGYFDAWVNGVNWDNLTEILIGTTLLIGGLTLAFGTTVGAIAAVVSGVAMLVLGFKEWIRTGELSDETMLLIIGGLAALGLGLSLLTGSWIPLLVAAVASLVVVVIKNWDKIKAKTIEIWTAVKDFFIRIWTTIKNKAIEVWDGIERGASNCWESVKTTAETLWTGIKDSILGIWDGVKTGISEKWDSLVFWFQEKWDLLKMWWENLTLNPFNILTPHLEWYWEEVGGVVGKILSTLGLPAQIPHLSVTWMAKGGIVDGATLFGAGEAGREAIIPLERNTGWIKNVAHEILNAMDSKYDGALAGMPAMAMGGIAPPRALNSSGSMFSDGDIDRLISGFATVFGGGGYGDQKIQLVVDGRTLAEVVTKQQSNMNRGAGR